MEEKTETKNIGNFALIIILIVAILVGGIIYWWSKKVSVSVPVEIPTKKPVERIVPKEDSVSAINQELESVQTLDLEKEFQEIDQDLNSL